jgi:hypothetical protein
VNAEAAVKQKLGSLHEHTGQDWAPPIDDPSGQDVLNDTVRVSLESLGSRLLAAYALGRLAHGGFSPLVSDVDVALILADPILTSDEESLLGAAEKVRSMGSPLHTRVSIFWGTPASLGGRTAGGRFPPLDRPCLLEHGRLLTGSDVRERAAPVQTGSLARAHRPDLLVTAGVRWTTKIVLFPVRFLFTAETGR